LLAATAEVEAATVEAPAAAAKMVSTAVHMVMGGTAKETQKAAWEEEGMGEVVPAAVAEETVGAGTVGVERPEAVEAVTVCPHATLGQRTARILSQRCADCLPRTV